MSYYDDKIVEALANFEMPDFSEEKEEDLVRFFNTSDFASGKAFCKRYADAVYKKSKGSVKVEPLSTGGVAWILGTAAYLRLVKGSKRIDFLVSPSCPPFQTKEMLHR